jgi:hypothetical protein
MCKDIPFGDKVRRVMYRLNHNQDVIGLLLRLKEFEEEYPVRLLAVRRSSFVNLVARYVGALVRMYY